MESLLYSQLLLHPAPASESALSLLYALPGQDSLRSAAPNPSPSAASRLPWLSLTVLAPALWATQLVPAQAAVQMGDTCGAVGDVQMALAEMGFSPGPIDGVFGSNTEAALLRFQEAQNLAVDGIAGLETAAALGLDTSATSPYAPGQACAGGGLGGEAPPEVAEDLTAIDRFRFYTVTSEILNVRSGPGTEYDIVATLGEGDRIEGQATESGWMRLRSGDWVAGNFLTEVETQPLDEPEASVGASVGSPLRIRVAVEVLNVREQPSLDSPIVGTLLQGEEYETTGQVTATGWVQLAWGDWVAAEHVVPVEGGDLDAATLDIIEASAPTTEATEVSQAQVSTLGSPLLVREAPGGEVVDLLADGTTVELSGRSENGWSQLRNGYWVAADYLVI